jgi:hypothetical protein
MKRNGEKKEGQATFIAPLQPLTFATFPSWRIKRELVVKDLPQCKISYLFDNSVSSTDFFMIKMISH